jgi:biopolymer transport protein ExbB/TolQ
MSVLSILRVIVDAMATPVVIGLIGLTVLIVIECGIAFGERCFAIPKLRLHATVPRIERLAKDRISRADVLARTGPMLGLMGTLIPLGPALAGLGEGNIKVLAEGITMAFDTTVLGLFNGAFGYAIGHLRRRWYEDLLDEMESRNA